MQQASISNHFKNIKRKSALNAKEKISNLNGTSTNKPGKNCDDNVKAVKFVPETSTNSNRITLENSTLLPLKRRSTRLNNDENNITSKAGEEEDFEIPKTLEKNKKFKLEENINKKRKREEESINNIKNAKAKLMQKKGKNAKKNGKAEFNDSLKDENIMELDESLSRKNKQKETKNSKKGYADSSENKLGFVNNDVSEKTKNLVKKVLESKIKLAKFEDEQINLMNNNNINSKKKALNATESNKNFSTDKNYISDDVLDTVEETFKNKKQKNLISKLSEDIKSYNLSLRERTPQNVKANKANKTNKNINCNNIIEEAILKSSTGNSFISINSNDLLNSVNGKSKKATSNEINNSNNNNIFESPAAYVFNKINNDFSFDQKEENEPKANLNNTANNINLNKADKKNTKKNEAENNSGKNLLLSMEANKSEFKKPELSQKTLKIISEISKIKEEKRLNNFKREETKTKERDRSESSFSLKFKYEELVLKERELPLPTKFKKLLIKFGQLDQTLNFFKISKSNKIPSFNEIKRSMEITYKEDFEIEHFLQILYIVPHFFVYTWEKLNNIDKDYTLLIGIPSKIEEKMISKYTDESDFIKMQTTYEPCYDPLSKEILEKRKMIFKNILLEMVNKDHKKFLEKIQITRAFDPFKMKTWYSQFSLEEDVNVEIPIFEISDKPIYQIINFAKFFNENNLKSDLIKKAIEQASIENAKEQSNDSQANSSPQANSNSNILTNFVSNRLLQMIKAKENAVKLHSDILEYSTQKSKQKSRLLDIKDLIDRMKNIFIMQRYATIPMSELCEKIQSGSDSISSVDSIDSIKKIIYALKEHFPTFLTIRDHHLLGTVVRMDPNASIKDILEQIENKDLADKLYGL